MNTYCVVSLQRNAATRFLPRKLWTRERSLGITRTAEGSQRVDRVDDGIFARIVELQPKNLGSRGDGQRQETGNKEGALHGWRLLCVVLERKMGKSVWFGSLFLVRDNSKNVGFGLTFITTSHPCCAFRAMPQQKG